MMLKGGRRPFKDTKIKLKGARQCHQSVCPSASHAVIGTTRTSVPKKFGCPYSHLPQNPNKLRRREEEGKILETQIKELETHAALMARLIAAPQQMEREQKRLETMIEKLELWPLALMMGVGAVVGFLVLAGGHVLLRD